MPDVRDIVANLDDPTDPNLHREMDLVQYLLIQGASAEVPFSPYLSKSKKKKQLQWHIKPAMRVSLLHTNLQFGS